jgi:deoxycytidylate deaminase
MSSFELNWADIAFGSKKTLRDLKAIFIPTPREMSARRFKQLIKQYLPVGNIIVGFADELYIDGFDNQPQFKTLQPSDIMELVSKVNNSSSPNKITLLHCHQSDILPILNKIKFRLVLLINGSWKYSFHTRPEYYALVSQNIPFEFISPFADEVEAIYYANNIKQVPLIKNSKLLTDVEIMRVANQAATASFDTSFQTGALLAKKSGAKYKLITSSYNKTVPYLTFAWHFGAQRESHLSLQGDLNYYDTVHAEVMLLLEAQKNKLNLAGMSLFVNLLPCPTCARMLCETDINEIVYSFDHSDGYAVALLEKAGKTVRRIIDTDDLIKKEG